MACQWSTSFESEVFLTVTSTGLNGWLVLQWATLSAIGVAEMVWFVTSFQTQYLIEILTNFQLWKGSKIMFSVNSRPMGDHVMQWLLY